MITGTITNCTITLNDGATTLSPASISQTNIFVNGGVHALTGTYDATSNVTVSNGNVTFSSATVASAITTSGGVANFVGGTFTGNYQGTGGTTQFVGTQITSSSISSSGLLILQSTTSTGSSWSLLGAINAKMATFTGGQIDISGGSGNFSSSTFGSVTTIESVTNLAFSNCQFNSPCTATGATLNISSSTVTASLEATSSTITVGSTTMTAAATVTITGGSLAVTGGSITSTTLTINGVNPCSFDGVQSSQISLLVSASAVVSSTPTTIVDIGQLTWQSGTLALNAKVNNANLAIQDTSSITGSVKVTGTATWTTATLIVGAGGVLTFDQGSSLISSSSGTISGAGSFVTGGTIKCGAICIFSNPKKQHDFLDTRSCCSHECNWWPCRFSRRHN